MLKPGPSLSSLLDVTHYMKLLRFWVIPAGSFQVKTALEGPDSCSVDMNKNLLFRSIDTATFYYQRCPILLPEIQVPRNSNYINYIFFYTHLKVIVDFRAGCWQCKCMCFQVSLNQSDQWQPLHWSHTGIWKWWQQSTTADWLLQNHSEGLFYIVLTSHLDRELWG